MEEDTSARGNEFCDELDLFADGDDEAVDDEAPYEERWEEGTLLSEEDDESDDVYAGAARSLRVAEYDGALIEAVWEEADEVPGVDPALWRQDECGEWMHRYDYGKRQSRFGWRIFDPGVGRRGGGQPRAVHVQNLPRDE